MRWLFVRRACTFKECEWQSSCCSHIRLQETERESGRERIVGYTFEQRLNVSLGELLGYQAQGQTLIAGTIGIH